MEACGLWPWVLGQGSGELGIPLWDWGGARWLYWTVPRSEPMARPWKAADHQGLSISSTESLKNMCQGGEKIASLDNANSVFKEVSVVLTLWKMSKPNFANDLPFTGHWNSVTKREKHKLSSIQVQILDASFLRCFTGNVTLSKLHILSESVQFKSSQTVNVITIIILCVPEGTGIEASMNSTDISFQKARSVCIYI